MEYLLLQSTKDIERLLDFEKIYRRFTNSYSGLTIPLQTPIIWKTKFYWTPNTELGFQ